MSNGSSTMVKVYPEILFPLSDDSSMFEVIIGSSGPTVTVIGKKDLVSITSNEATSNKTVIVTNSTNVLATDIIANGILFFYKIPLVNSVPIKVTDIITGRNIAFYYDSDYVYTIDDAIVEVEMESGDTILDKPVEIFLNDSMKMNNKYYKDNKTYTLKSYYNNLKMIFNRGNLNIVPGKSTVRVRNFSNIIHLDSFSKKTVKFIFNERDLLSSVSGRNYYSSADINNFFDMNPNDVSPPFLIPKNIVEIFGNVVMIEIYGLNNQLYSIQFDIDGQILYQNVIAGCELITKVKVKRVGDQIVAGAFVKAIEEVEKRFCGSERLKTKHEGCYLPHNIGQVFIDGVRDGDSVQFDIQNDILLYNTSNLSVRNEDNALVQSVIVDGIIYAKSTSKIGISYNNIRPGILI